MMKRTRKLIKTNELQEAMGISPDYQLVSQQGGKSQFPIRFRKNNETIEVDESDLTGYLEGIGQNVSDVELITVNEGGIQIDMIAEYP